MLHVEAIIRPHAVGEEGAGSSPAELVRDYRADQDVAFELETGADDRLDARDRRHDAALVVMGAHAPDPAILELTAIGIDAPAAHLNPRIHVAVEHQARAAAAANQAADRLAAALAALRRMRHLHHLHFEAEIPQVAGQMIRERAFLEGGARN